MRQPRALAPLGAALAACLLALLMAAPTAALAAKPIKGKPKIVDIEGFAYPTDTSLEHWRAGALLITRYPKVLPKAFPAQIRKLLTFRAIGSLKVFAHGKRIASRKDKGGLPVFVAGHSVYYAHLLIATQKQSDRIFESLGLEKSKLQRGWPSAGNVHTRASANERVKAKGRTVASAGTKSAQSVNLAGAADPPYVVNGCAIQPNTQCPDAELSEANLTNANLTGANLTYADLTVANLTGANLTGADIVNADLTHANLTLADLTRADLTGDYLNHADLTAANLRHAALNSADLSLADLTDADLTGAFFTAANFTGANLTRANLTGADFTGAMFCNTTMPDGSINDDDCTSPP